MHRVVIIGYGTIAAKALRILKELGIGVPVVITDGPDPGEDTWRLSLVKAAKEFGYVEGSNLLAVKNANRGEILEKIRSAGPDLILSLQPKSILRPALISIPRIGVVNLHNSPLPLLRGCDPFAWAIHDGLKTMGASLHFVLDEGIDSGPIIAQRFWDINDATTAWDLYLWALNEGEILLREQLVPILEGKAKAREQDSRFATYHSMHQFVYGDMRIHWNAVHTTLSTWIRSRIFLPFQTPYFELDGHRFYVLGCHAEKGPSRVGELMKVEGDSIWMGAKWGCVVIDRIATEPPNQGGLVVPASNVVAASVIGNPRYN